MRNRNFFRSFCHAARGVVHSLQTQRNLRAHLAAAVYVMGLGLLAELAPWAWMAVLFCVGGVLAAELFNTALEDLCDVACPQWHPKIGAAKDGAAGAVLVLALVSVGVAVVIFGPWLLSGGLLRRPWAVAAAVLLLPLVILWIRGKPSC